jgi:hypothetical protein
MSGDNAAEIIFDDKIALGARHEVFRRSNDRHRFF